MLKAQKWGVLLALVLLGLCSQTARALDASASHKKWVIITSISYPTEAIKVLANMTDWKVESLTSPWKISRSRHARSCVLCLCLS